MLYDETTMTDSELDELEREYLMQQELDLGLMTMENDRFDHELEALMAARPEDIAIPVTLW